MEFRCPKCQQPLRAPDHLRNPLVRCRRCAYEFRPVELGLAVPARSEPEVVEPELVAPELVDRQPPTPTPTPQIRPRKTTTAKRSRSGQGWGWIIVIGLMLLSRAPRWIQRMNRPAPNPPVQQHQFVPNPNPVPPIPDQQRAEFEKKVKEQLEKIKRDHEKMVVPGQDVLKEKLPADDEERRREINRLIEDMKGANHP